MSQGRDTQQRPSYLQRWHDLSPTARLYLLHAALLTGSLAVSGLFFNLLILALGYPITFIGTLDTTAIAVAACSSVPLWWLVTRIGYRRALVANALLQTAAISTAALLPRTGTLLLTVAMTGAAAVLFQVSSPPFMMQHSDDRTRDHLFSANWGINIGVAGIASLIAGGLPARFAAELGVGAESALAYRATFGVAAAGLLLSLVPLAMIKNQQTNKPTNQEQRAQNTEHRTQNTEHTSPVSPVSPRHPVTPPPRHLLPPPLRAMLANPWPLLSLLVSPLLISFGAALTIRYLNLYFKQRFGISDTVLGSIFALFGIATGVATLLAPLISNRIGKIRTVALAQLLSMPFLLIAGFVPYLFVAVGAELLRRALFNMGAPLYDAFAMERSAEDARPYVIGIINGAYTVGYLIAPIISTRIQLAYGFEPLFVATAVSYALAVTANYLLFIRPRAARLEVVGDAQNLT